MEEARQCPSILVSPPSINNETTNYLYTMSAYVFLTLYAIFLTLDTTDQIVPKYPICPRPPLLHFHVHLAHLCFLTNPRLSGAHGPLP